VGLDNESRTPTLPTLGGIVSNIDVNKSYVETDLNDINYVSEGFLGRYYYKLVPKPTSFWSKLLKALAVVVVLAAAAVATVFTAGFAGIGIGAGLGAALVGGGFTVGATIGTIGIVAGSLFAATGLGLGIEAITLKVRQKRNKGKALLVKGRKEKIPDGYQREELEESR
jgi:hypothetical protein